jgi:hypothetical protein
MTRWFISCGKTATTFSRSSLARIAIASALTATRSNLLVQGVLHKGSWSSLYRILGGLLIFLLTGVFLILLYARGSDILQLLVFVPHMYAPQIIDILPAEVVAVIHWLTFIPFIIILIEVVAVWKILTKAGQPGWGPIIPIYNLIVLLRMVGKPAWWIFLLIIPVVNIVVGIMLTHELSKSFGKGTGFTWGLLFLPLVFYPILGFGSDPYLDTGGESAGMTPMKKGCLASLLLAIAVFFLLVETAFWILVMARDPRFNTLAMLIEAHEYGEALKLLILYLYYTAIGEQIFF